MFLHSRVSRKFLELLAGFAVFFTPLLFFIRSHDQFELPKLTLLMVLLIPFLAYRGMDHSRWRPTPLTFALLFLFTVQGLATFPPVSMSWRNSLWGEYENFAGWTTWGTYFLWFGMLNRILNEAKIEKWFLFNSLAALLSSLYALGQHFGLDFIQWNPESVNATREFASLGNPNFLSAYLAMSIPLFLAHCLREPPSSDAPDSSPLPVFWVSAPLGLGLCLLGSASGTSLFPPSDSDFLGFLFRALGLFLLAPALLRFLLWRHGSRLFFGLLLLSLGLFSTSSRGGFLGALVGITVGLFFTLREGGQARPVLETILMSVKKNPALPVLGLLAALVFGRSFFSRLASSILHMGQSLEVSRLHIWRPALSMVAAHPLLGLGLDNFKTAFPFYSGIEFNLIDGMFMSSRTAHNELLQTAATTGLLGLAAYLGVLAAFGLMWWRAYRGSGPSARLLLIGILSSAVAYHVQNLFSFGVSSINFLWFFLLAGTQALYRKTRPQDALSPASGFFSLLRKTAVSIPLLFLFLFPLPRLGADIAFARGNAASDLLKRSRTGRSHEELIFYSDYEIHELQKSVELFPFDVKYRLYLGLAFEQRAQLDKDRSADWLGKALACYQQSASMSPANAYYYNDEGRIYDDLGHQDPAALPRAEEAYGEAVHWAPASPYFLINHSIALEKVGKEKESGEELRRAFTLSQAFSAKVLAQMAFAAYRGGDKPMAFKRIGQAIAGDPESPETLYCRGIMYLSQNEKQKALADFEEVQKLGVTPEKNPSIQNLDQFMEQASH